jgi:hypothetical protein
VLADEDRGVERGTALACVNVASDQVPACLDDLDVLPVRVFEDHELRTLERAGRRHLRLGVDGVALGRPFLVRRVDVLDFKAGVCVAYVVLSAAYRGRIMALWVCVYIGTTPVGSIITGAIISAAGPGPPC